MDSEEQETMQQINDSSMNTSELDVGFIMSGNVTILPYPLARTITDPLHILKRRRFVDAKLLKNLICQIDIFSEFIKHKPRLFHLTGASSLPPMLTLR